MIATRHGNFPVKKGDKLAGTRIIPLVIGQEKMDRAKEAAGKTPLLQVLPYQKRKAGIVTTGSEVYYHRIEDTFTPVLIEKLQAYGVEIGGHEVCNDDHEMITAAIKKLLDEGCDLILCTGGMSVDPDDRTPLAIKNTGQISSATVHRCCRVRCSYYPIMEIKSDPRTSGVCNVCKEDDF